MNPKQAFMELDEEYHGNFLFMPFEDKKEYRQAMRDAIKEELHTSLAMANLCKLDLYFLCHSILGFTDTKPEVHRPFCDNIEANPKGSVNMMPRGYFKSSLGTIGRSTQIVLNDPSERVLIANKTSTLAEKFVGKIKSFFESNMFIRDLFPQLIPTNFKKVKWNEQCFEINRPEKFVEGNVEAVGVGGTRVGHHYTTIIFDDLVDEDEIANINQMDKVIEWLRLAFGSFGVKGGFNEIHNATRWAYYDPISWVLDNRKDLSVFHSSCYQIEKFLQGIKESTFPEIYTTEELAELEVIKGTLTFSAQFLNDPLPSGTQLIVPEWIQFYDEPPPLDTLKIYVMGDPAISEERTACQRAYTVTGVDEDFNWYVLAFSAGRYPLIAVEEKDGKVVEKTSFISEGFKFHQVYDPFFFGIEEVAFQAVVRILFEKEMIERNYRFAIEGMKTSNRQTKEMRIESLAKAFGARKVYLAGWMRNSELYKQLVGYPAYRWKDLIDALSYMMRYAWPTRVSAPPQKKYKENTITDIHRRIDEARTINIFNRPQVWGVGCN